MNSKKTTNDYRFQYLPSKKIEFLENKEVNENLLKWSMKDRIIIQTFSFDKPFQKYQQQSFFQEFFTDPHVTSNLKVLSPNGRWASLGLDPKSVSLKEVPCSVTSMKFFDRLFGSEVVRESGSIVRCEEEFCEKLNDYVDDELKKMLLSGGELYSNEEREEFLMLLLTHLLVGGSLCQPDFQIHNYLKVAKILYRDLIRVHKDSCTNKVLVSSLVFKATLLDSSGRQIYPCSEEHFQNVAYACVDPLKKQIRIFNHRFGVTLPTIE